MSTSCAVTIGGRKPGRDEHRRTKPSASRFYFPGDDESDPRIPTLPGVPGTPYSIGGLAPAFL